jgi:adenosylcobinamide-GDP ribazoletransferase
MSITSFSIAVLSGGAALGILYAVGASTGAILAAVVAALLMRAYLAWRLQQRLGGYTGDCLGAVQQLSELAFYLGLLAAL